ncbi:hypothetical protein EDM56_17955 [Brevibacillus fluminis]|uniref:Copper amine oxidase-like N-terminal domain-containing protein n=1 Tax=Brevibacillus fluminis TaxID=511487 RepID=A0A3M8DCX4_9BACL|nr:nitrous oxide reductase accessory protein NosL [Brevibacillus fluminis]RNB85884.1 hypothetical protein EDM56_17955 [Brevibacillus fluminis]
MNWKKMMLMLLTLVLCSGALSLVSAHEGHTAAPHEPDKDTKCAYCMMKVYLKEEEMGKFTAQMLTADGKTLFFDDAGCMLNYKRTLAAEPQMMWVRDYNTLAWVEYGKANVVSANIKTPMQYGFAYFQTAADADSFVKNNNKLEAMKTDWTFVDKVAQKRSEMKMSGDMNHGQMNHGPAAAHGIIVMINGQKQSFQQAPMNMHGKVTVSAKELVQKLGATATWNAKGDSVTVKLGSKSATLSLEQHGQIGLRTLCEAVGAHVRWDGKTKTIIINSK